MEKATANSIDVRVTCLMRPFPAATLSDSKQTRSLDISALLDTRNLAVERVAAVWAVLVHLYSGLEHICFLSASAAYSGVQVYSIDDTTTLHSLVSSLRAGGVQAEPEEAYQYNTAVFLTPRNGLPGRIDLALAVQENGRCCILYRNTLLSDTEAFNVAQTLRHLANLSTTGPIAAIGPGSHDVENFRAWNAVAPLQQHKHRVHDLFHEVVQKQPKATAICTSYWQITYEQLDVASSHLAQNLMSQGVTPRSWILLCFEKSAFAILSMLAVMKAGAAFVSVDSRYPEQRLRQIISSTKARHVLLSPVHAAKFASMNLRIVPVNSEHLDEIATASFRPWPETLHSDPACAIFTSGSTGVPKGVLYDHTILATSSIVIGERLSFGSHTRLLQFAAYIFDVSLEDIFVTLLFGGTICVPSEHQRLNELGTFMEHQRVNFAHITPTVARILQVARLPDMRRISLSGEPVGEADIKPWVDAGVEVFNAYGPAEATMCNVGRKSITGRAANIGPALNSLLHVVDSEGRNRLVPAGAIGELWVEGPMLALGYLNDVERTRTSFTEAPEWLGDRMQIMHDQGPRRIYKTGDLVRYCPDGTLECLGRKDSQIKIGGQRVELADIEFHLHQIPSVETGAVFAPKAGPFHGKLMAVVAKEAGIGHTAQERGDSAVGLMEFVNLDLKFATSAKEKLREYLPSYMVPTVWVAVQKFCSTGSGKLDRRRALQTLESMSQDDYLRVMGLKTEGSMNDMINRGPQASDGIDHEDFLRLACGELLGIPPHLLPLERSWASLGGDSITAMQLVAKYRAVHKSLNIKDILMSSSLLDIGGAIKKASPGQIVPMEEPGKSFPLSPIQRAFMNIADSPETWNYYHQSVLMRLAAHKTIHEIEGAFSRLVERHSMLRARFQRSSKGDWTQYIEARPQRPFAFKFHGQVSPRQRDDLLLLTRKNFDITQGPMVRVDLIEEHGQQIMSIVVHHLVVDLVSWRIMLADLEHLLGHDEKTTHQEVPFPFQRWSELEVEWFRDVNPNVALSLEVPTPDFAFWEVNALSNVYGNVDHREIMLDPLLTRRLLKSDHCHAAFRTEPIDVLLASILVSFARTFPQRSVPAIMNEGHGREPWDARIDLSSTVGWFTIMYPVVAAVNGNDVTDAVKRVKDARRSISKKGWEYFGLRTLTPEGKENFRDNLPAEILFNYEGRYQTVEKQSSLLQQEDWKAGESLADSSPVLQRWSLFEISAAVLADCFNFTFAWNKSMKYQHEITRWIESFPSTVEEIVVALESQSPQFTLSDFPQMAIGYEQLPALTSKALGIAGGQAVTNVEDVYPCSPLQESLAISQAKQDSDSGLYEIELIFEVKTTANRVVDVERLVDAWSDTVARHSILRTAFVATSRDTAHFFDQVVLRTYQPEVELLICTTDSEALDRLNNYPRKPSCLESPPHRLLVCSSNNSRIFCKLEINHMIFDGISTAPLLNDFSLAYESRLPKNAVQYSQFVRHILEPSRRDSSIAYWKDYLQNAESCQFPPLLDTHPITIQQKSIKVPVTVEFSWLQSALGELNVTIATIFQLVWAVVVRVYASTDQVTFGYLVSGRNVPIDNIEKAVGPFIGMLLVLVEFSNDKSVFETMQKIQSDFINGVEHQACSLAEIQNALAMSGQSLFNCGISFQSLDKQHNHDRSSLIFQEISRHDPTEYDLSLIVETGKNALEVSLAYRTSAFNDGHMVNVANSVNHILMELLAHPHRQWADFTTLSQPDYEQIWDWNQSLIEPVHKCVHEIIETSMTKWPEDPAVFAWDGQLTYAELDNLSKRLAIYLRDQVGVIPETIVPLCFEKSVWALVSMLGLLRAGGCFVFLEPTHPVDRLAGIIEEVECPIVLCSKQNTPKLKQTGAPIVTIDFDFIHSLPPPQARPVCTNVTPENAMYVVFTSGTTGKPKGSVTSHSQYVTGLREHAWAIEVSKTSRTLQFSAYSFDASIGDICTTWQMGGCVCTPSEQDRSQDIVPFIARSKATWAGWTPSYASLIDPNTVPTLEVLLMAGEPLPASQVDLWVDRLHLLNIYGPSECSVACVVNKNVKRETNASNIGRGYRATTWIVDENDHEKLAPIGAVGELLIEGPVVARGYLKRPEQTAHAFIGSPYWLRNGRHKRHSRLYKTGDLVRYNSDGTINFVARKDTQLKINGQRVELGEIEQHLCTILGPGPPPLAVELLKREGEKDLLTAFILVAPDGFIPKDSTIILANDQQSLQRLRDFVTQIDRARSSMPAYMMPTAFVPLSIFPVTTAGKLDRRALKALAARLSRDEVVSFTTQVKEPGRTDEERLLIEIWKDALQLQEVGVHDNFFRLGGDSILAMKFSARARQQGLALSVAQIFTNASIAELSEVLSTSPSDTLAEHVEPFSLLGGYATLDELQHQASQDCGISISDIDDIFPATPMQEGLMTMTTTEPSSQAYSLHSAFRLPPDMDEENLCDAWNEVKQSCAVLRGRLIATARGALMVIVKRPDAVLTFITEIEELIDSQRKIPFGYGIPLIRAALVCDKADRFFVVSAHHAIYDGFSTRLMWEAVNAAYNGYAVQVEPQYQAFVKQVHLAPQQAARDYWRSKLVEQSCSQFPLVPETVRPKASKSMYIDIDLPLKPAHLPTLTPSTLIVAAWAILLSQYSGSAVPTFGTTLSGRDIAMPGIERLMGPTMITVPRQIHVDISCNAAEFINNIQLESIAMIPWQNLGLDEIRRLGTAGRQACTFKFLLAIQPESAIRSAEAELGLEALPVDVGNFHPFPLAVSCWLKNDNLGVEVQYDPNCIDAATVELLIGQLDVILRNIASSTPTQNISSLLSFPERELAMIHQNALRCASTVIEEAAPSADDHPRTDRRMEEFSSDERLLQECLASVLDIAAKDIGLESNFFALGGNSITAMRLLTLLKVNKRNLQFEDVFGNHTLRELAQMMSFTGDGDLVIPEPFELIPKSTLQAVFDEVLPRYDIDPTLVEDIYPCTPLQEALMVSTFNNSGAYISFDTCEVPGDSVGLLKRAWDEIFRRFDMLRTRIVTGDKHGTLQIVMRHESPSFGRVKDFATFRESVYDAHGYGYPLAHLGLIDLEDGKVKCVFGAHHSAYDGLSLTTIWESLAQEMSQPRSIAKTPAVPFRAFVNHLLRQDRNDAARYWKRKVAGIDSSPLHLISETSNRSVISSDVLEHEISLSAESDGILASTLARAAWTLTLSHYSANSDVSFGTILSGRESGRFSTMVGPTISTVPVRYYIDYNTSVSAFLEDVQADSVESIRHSHLGLQGIARLNSDTRQACAFGTLLVIQPPSDAVIDNPNLIHHPQPSDRFYPHALMIECVPRNDETSLRAIIRYDPDVVSQYQVGHIMSTFATIFAGLADQKRRQHPLVEIRALSDERTADMARLSSENSPETIPCLVQDLVAPHVNSTPGRVAIDAWDGSFTFAELDELSNGIANELIRRGIQSEEAIPIMFEKTKWANVAMLGIWKAGGCFVPLDPAHPMERLQFIIDTVKASTCLTSSRHASKCGELGCDTLLINEAFVTNSEQSMEKALSTTCRARGETLAYIIFTSGSTGTPKGVANTHRALCSSMIAHGKLMAVDAQSRALQFISYTFDPMLMDIWTTLVHGGCVCVPSDSQRMNDISGFIRDFSVNCAVFTPSLSRTIDPSTVSPLKMVVMGGEPMLHSDIERWASRVKLFNAYGPTEASIACVMHEMQPGDLARNIGFPVGCRAWVVNPLKSELSPMGAIGELCVEGPILAKEYLHDPQKTKTAFIENPAWHALGEAIRVYRTGDLVYYNADGTLSYFARQDGQIKIRGQRVELAEIEDVIRQAIADDSITVAVDFTDGKREELTALLGLGTRFKAGKGSSEMHPDTQKVMAELVPPLQSRLQKKLPAYMVPTGFVAIDVLPITSSGKLDRKLLKSRIAALSSKATERTNRRLRSIASLNIHEKILLRVWSTILSHGETSEFSATDNFFDAGGDSIIAMHLVSLLRREHYSLSVQDIFANPTLRNMALAMQPRKVDRALNGHAANGLPNDAGPESVVSDGALAGSVSNGAIRKEESSGVAGRELVMRSISRTYDIPLTDMQDVYPATDMQTYFLKNSTRSPGSHVVRFVFSCDPSLDLHRLLTAVNRCARTFPILRTRIAEDAGSFYQVVMFGDINYTTSTMTLEHTLEHDTTISTGLGDVLHRLTLVHGKDSKSLVWTLHHALYDAWTLKALIGHIEQAYLSEKWQPPPHLPFSTAISHLKQMDRPSAKRFWASQLSSAQKTTLWKYDSVPNPRHDTRAIYRAAMPSSCHGATSSTVLLAAWALLVARLTGTNDVTMGCLLHGRAALIEGIETTIGPLITKIPLRVCLPSIKCSLVEVVRLVQAQLISVMPYENAGLELIKSSCKEAPIACDFPIDLIMHPAGNQDLPGSDIGLKQTDVSVATSPPGPFSVESSVDGENVNMMAVWDHRAVERGVVDVAFEQFRIVLESL